jgi:hypothetical protein
VNSPLFIDNLKKKARASGDSAPRRRRACLRAELCYTNLFIVESWFNPKTSVANKTNPKAAKTIVKNIPFPFMKPSFLEQF